MPCRRPGEERRLLLLERAASAVSLQTEGGGGGGSSSSVVGAGEVDALVTKLGEVLQLNAQNRTPTSAAAAAASDPRLLLGPKQRSRDRLAPYASPRGLAFLASLQQSESPRGAKQLCGRGWLRRRKHLHHPHPKPRLRCPLLAPDEEDDDDPHRLLQQLILSGNLIKEAVRRLQLAAAEAARSSPPTASSSSTSSASSSASSAGSCGCHSSSGEGDAASLPVSTLRALP